MKFEKEIDYAESKEPFRCQLESCEWNQTRKHHSGTYDENVCICESADECPYHELFHQVRERKELNEVTIPNVISVFEPSEKQVRELVINKLNTVLQDRELLNRADASKMCYNYFQVRDIIKEAQK